MTDEYKSLEAQVLLERSALLAASLFADELPDPGPDPESEAEAVGWRQEKVWR